MASFTAKILLLLFLFAGNGYAENFPLPIPGAQEYTLMDSTALAGGESDTTRGIILMRSVDMAAYMAQYTSRNDSTNILVRADFSADGERWVHTITLDSVLVSGTTDSTEAKRLDDFPDWPIYCRVRTTNNAVATSDTVDVYSWLILHYLAKPRLW